MSCMDRYLITQAYRYVAIAVMLAEANYYCGRLNLPNTPIRETEITVVHVSPLRQMGFGGRIETKQFAFGFGGPRNRGTGVLSFVVRLNRFEKVSQAELNRRWARMTS